MHKGDFLMRQDPRPLERLLVLMGELRHPERGCPWDLEQTFATIAPYTIEEAYEVADAIERGDMDNLRSELGDLLFQVVFHSRMAEERQLFDFDAVAQGIIDKMIARHPHVFGDSSIADAQAQTVAWEEYKAKERAARGGDSQGVLDGVAATLPPMVRALKLQQRAARVGFDWASPQDVMDKLAEETAEVAAEIPCDGQGGDQGGNRDRLEDEIGDLMFVCVNLARKLDVDPDRALKRANAKFERRFRHIENRLAQTGRAPSDSTLTEMEELWIEAKETLG